MIVNKIWERSGVALVEWVEDSEIRRSIVPSADLVGNECLNPGMGMDYGVPWAELVSYQLDPKELERKLRSAGIWTEEDFYQNPKLLRGVTIEIAGDILSSLLRNVKVGLSNTKE